MYSKIVGFVIFFWLIFSGVGMAKTTIGAGPVIHKGHSWSGQTKVDPPGYMGKGGIIRYEDREERPGFFGFGATLVGFQFGKQDNETSDRSWETCGLVSADISFYLLRFFGVESFLRTGVGGSIATDGLQPAFHIGGGVEKAINNDYSIELFGTSYFTPERRHDFFGIMLKYSF